MSAHTHGGLTYNSVSDAIHAHDRKGIGREGKGREGNRRSPSIHNVTQVTREAAPEQTVAPSDEWMDGIDFEAEVPCEVHDAEHRAHLIAALICPNCGPIPKAICWQHWHWLSPIHGYRVRCEFCVTVTGWRDEVCRVIEVLR